MNCIFNYGSTHTNDNKGSAERPAKTDRKVYENIQTPLGMRRGDTHHCNRFFLELKRSIAQDGLGVVLLNAGVMGVIGERGE